jgi:peptidoglycan/LPS O-acetylase OafA/YrhL
MKTENDAIRATVPSMKGAAPRKLFFPNLNGVRFVAALMVIVHHVEQTKIYFHLPSRYQDNVMGTDLGGLGVTLFFVLSGFLITYLLLVEKNQSGTVSLRDFYVRRILRIWPLYYFVVLLAFFVIPAFFPGLMIGSFADKLPVHFWSKLAMYACLVPNVIFVLHAYYPPVLFASQAWSVGVEEQFYAVWPMLVKYSRRLPVILGAIVAAFVIVGILIALAPDDILWLYFLRDFLLVTRIDCMAVGGLAAWLLVRNAPALAIIYSVPVQCAAYVLTFILVYFKVSFQFSNHLPYAILFALLLLNLAANPKTLLHLNNRVFDYLGRISYGLYMYHMLAIVVAIRAVLWFTSGHSSMINALIYVLSLCLVVLISTVSYEFFEKPFLKLKVKFSTIVSGDNAH